MRLKKIIYKSYANAYVKNLVGELSTKTYALYYSTRTFLLDIVT